MKVKRYIGDNEISSEITPNIKNIDNVISDAIIKVRHRMSANCNKEITQLHRDCSSNSSNVRVSTTK